ncbi:MAG: VWA domain-containing protein [Bdellovibrio sp.]|nr:VWA domain-containing protein [Bdellovibrio sp.]
MLKISSVLIVLLLTLSAWSFQVTKQQMQFNKITLEVEVNTLNIQTDLLFVVDNSGSMTNHQRNLASNINKLVSQLNNYDLHAAVVTADMDSFPGPLTGGKLVNGYVSNSDSYYLQKLEQNILSVGTNGSGIERHFDSILAALANNIDFLRPNAHLAIVLLTDAEDQSKITTADFVTSLKGRKSATTSITFNTILVPSGEMKCERDTSMETPLKIEDAVKILGGATLNICENFGAQIQDIGQFIGQKGSYFNRIIQLPLVPSSINTVKVTYGNTELVIGDLNFGWVYDSKLNTILIGQLFDPTTQPSNTKLYIEFVPN